MIDLDGIYEFPHIIDMKHAVTTDEGTRGRRLKRFALRDASTGRILTVTEEQRPAVPSQVSRAYKLSDASVGLMLSALSAATSKSQSAGAPMQFIVEVKPNGTPRIVEALADATPQVPQAANELAMDADEEADLERALGEARERGRHAVAEILSGTDMLSADAFADHLKTQRVTINSWRQAHRVLGLQGATRGYRYPVWQIGEDGRPFAALPELFEIFGGSPWAVYRFLVQHHDELDGVTGREALRRGSAEAVLAAARGIAEGTFA